MKTPDVSAVSPLALLQPPLVLRHSAKGFFIQKGTNSQVAASAMSLSSSTRRISPVYAGQISGPCTLGRGLSVSNTGRRR